MPLVGGHTIYSCASDLLYEMVEGRASGVVVDTPSAFAANTGGNADHRQSLIKACVDAFRSESLPSSRLLLGCKKLFSSQSCPCCGA